MYCCVKPETSANCSCVRPCGKPDDGARFVQQASACPYGQGLQDVAQCVYSTIVCNQVLIVMVDKHLSHAQRPAKTSDDRSF